jgi:hypothetical protein
MLSRKEVPPSCESAFYGRITNRQVAEVSAPRFATKVALGQRPARRRQILAAGRNRGNPGQRAWARSHHYDGRFRR